MECQFPFHRGKTLDGGKRGKKTEIENRKGKIGRQEEIRKKLEKVERKI